MASLSASITSYSNLKWRITGLGNSFNTSYYDLVFVSFRDDLNGRTYRSSYAIDHVEAGRTGTSTSSDYSTTEEAFSGSQTFYGYAVAANGICYSAGSSNLTFLAATTMRLSDGGATWLEVRVSKTGADFYAFECDNGGYGSGPDRRFKVDDLTPNTAYGFRGQYKLNEVWSAYSDWEDFSTSDTLPYPGNAPSNLVATQTAPDKVQLTWTKATGEPKYHMIDWKVNGGEYERLTSESGTSSSFISVGSFSIGNKHTYRIFATKDDYKQSGYAYSNEITIGKLKLATPTNVVASKVPNTTTGGIQCSWNSVPNAKNYVVEYKNTTSTTWTVWGNGTGTSTKIPETDKSKSYQFRIKAQAAGWTDSEYAISNETGAFRPSDFTWIVTPVQGNTFNLKADDWNNLCKKTNEFLTYKQKTTKSFTSASIGADFTAAMFNEVRNAIAEINTNNLPATQEKGNDISASILTGLANTLNATS